MFEGLILTSSEDPGQFQLPEFLSGSRGILQTTALNACSYLAVPSVTLMAGSVPDELAVPKLAPLLNLAFKDFSPMTPSRRKFFAQISGIG